jgi:hypothetical protein
MNPLFETHSLFRRVRSRRARGWKRPGILLMIIGLFILGAAACGDASSSGDVERTRENGASTPTATSAANGGTASSSGSQEIYVPPQEFKGFTLPLQEGDIVQIHFVARSQVVGRSALGTGGSETGAVESAVTLAVTDPLGNVVYRGEETQEDTIEITSDVVGEYTFTFVNSFNLQGQSVVVDYAVNP